MLVYFSENLAGVSDSNHIIGNILCNHAAGAHHNIIPYCNAGQNNCARAYPAVSADVNRSVVLINLLAKLGKYRVSCGGNGYVRAEHGIISDINMRIIHHCCAEITVNISAEMNMRTAEI